MLKIITNSNWLTGALIFFMPVTLILFLGSQMAYSQVKGKFDAYQRIPEITTLADLEKVPAGQLIMLRGQISGATPSGENGLIIYRERPADGRKVRYREEFPLVFPRFEIGLLDGQVTVVPSTTRERVIQHELHAVTVGDRQHTGFTSGDVVSVQGQWQPEQSGLIDVTGVTGTDKQSLMIEWQSAFQKVGWARNGLGLITLLSLVLLIVQLRRAKANRISGEWQKTKTAPVT